ncbi:cytotoxic necrotizing factor Rho-activating domain-containing protein [Paraburkholderia rhizosphaerae]|uniref:cytotoxic necrotizing factor Rho-activating domain-containing protein n=1 Tax=Paraburkholderia rhizosphaerae TaxID=480658 RepID=UPI0010663316|nr:cytotoxic necrotizing factor Rho-activating domain-containing protein [Paraburkholderia rhizosphaerae]
MSDSFTQQTSYAASDAAGSSGTGIVERQKRSPAPPSPPSPLLPGKDESADHNNAKPGDGGVAKVRISGIKIKTQYSTREVLQIAGDAFTGPFTSFMRSAGDHATQLFSDRRLTKEEQANIDYVGKVLDKLAGIAPVNGATQFAGTMVNHLNQAIHGDMPTPEQMGDHIHGVVSMFSVELKMPNAVKFAPGRDILELPGQPPAAPAPGGTWSSAISPPTSVRQGVATIKRLKAAGPVNLEPARDAGEDQQRIEQFKPRFSYYRNDKDTLDLLEPIAASRTDADARDGVLAVGKGEDATSYFPEANAYVGRNWTPRDGISELQGANIIKLGPGKDGVAAMRLNFEDIPPGSTTVVTGGPMQTSTMLFAADQKSFYAYHAGRSTRGWSMAENGARSIVNAHELMRPDDASVSSTSLSNRDQLVAAARQYPFSTLIHYGKYTTDPQRKTSDDRINAADDRGDPARASSKIYSYFTPLNEYPRPIGTAEAVISKSKQGVVTVQVLGERGYLDSMKHLGDGAVGFRYKSIDSMTTSYTVPPSTQ